MFVERDGSGTMSLRRGFTLKPDTHVLVVEDVWTTGGSTQEAISVVEEAGGRVVAAGTPEQVARNPQSHTGKFLTRVLNSHNGANHGNHSAEAKTAASPLSPQTE